MKDGTILEDLRKHEIPERVTIVKGGGGEIHKARDKNLARDAAS